MGNCFNYVNCLILSDTDKELESKDFSFWENVLFADESKFNLFGSDGRPNVWKRSNEKLLAKKTKQLSTVVNR